MKKQLSILLALILVLCLAAGCSKAKEEKSAEATTEGMADFFDDEPEEPVPDKPEQYVKLGKYQGLTVNQESSKVTDKDVSEEIRANMAPETVDVTDRDVVKEGDILLVDYEVSVDGEPIEEYSQEERTYYLGENEFSFLKNDFDKDLIGKKVGEQFETKNAFADNLSDLEYEYEDYDDEYEEGDESLSADDLDDGGLEPADAEDGEEPFEEEIEGEEDEDEKLAGKPCTIIATVQAIQKEVMPKLTDEYISDFTNGEFNTVDAYRSDMKKQLEAAKEEEVKQKALHDLMVQIVNNSEQIKDFPEKLIQEEKDYLTDEISMEIQENMDEDEALSFEDYFKANYKEYKDFDEYVLFKLKSNCVHDLLVDAYKINPTDEQIKEAAKIYLDFGFESVEEVYDAVPEKELKNMAIDNLLEENLKKDNNIVETNE